MVAMMNLVPGDGVPGDSDPGETAEWLEALESTLAHTYPAGTHLSGSTTSQFW